MSVFRRLPRLWRPRLLCLLLLTLGGSCPLHFGTTESRSAMTQLPSRTHAPSTDSPAVDNEALLTPSEVAALFRVDPKTVTRWACAGKLTSLRTLGGHRRYRELEVRNLLGQADSGS